MDSKDIDWKEAREGHGSSNSEDGDCNSDHELPESSDHPNYDVEPANSQVDDLDTPSITAKTEPESINHGYIPKKDFDFKRLNLNLRSNIVSLADLHQHKSKPSYSYDDNSETFAAWLEKSLVAISPNADTILFVGKNVKSSIFIAKLRMDPINQYVTKPLNIPLDYDEYITSVLCLPIMSTQATAVGLVDWTALVIGLSSGYVKFYTEQSICLLSFKFCDEPVASLKCQTQKITPSGRSDAHFPTIVDELLIIYKSTAMIADGLGLYNNLRLAKEEMVRNGSGYEPAFSLSTLPSIMTCQKWKIDAQRGGPIFDGDLLGVRRISTFNSLLSESINSVTSHSKGYARTLGFVGQSPFFSSIREPKETKNPSYTEIIGSIFSIWNKPQPSRTQTSEVNNPTSTAIHDKGRLVRSFIPSPDKRLAVMTDDYGRVMLLDITNSIIIRMWKGYRSAQCGWIEVQKDPSDKTSPYASFLAIYAPKRGLLEIWSTQRGPRVAAFNVGRECRLLYSGYKMFNMRAEVATKKANPIGSLVEQCYSSHCYLLNPNSEILFRIELPYTYSLYNYSDLKSRDHLLIRELTNAIRSDSEVEVLSEALHRMSLAESLEVSVQNLALESSPEKIVPVMENLIIMIMKKYDNSSGQTMTVDDKSFIELAKRIIQLCALFQQLSESSPNELPLPDVNYRLIEQYDDHPQEIDKFSENLGWNPSEVLRYLSLAALDRSCRKEKTSSPWPSIGEPLSWTEFIGCFDLKRQSRKRKSLSKQANSSVNDEHDFKILIRLKECNSKFLSEDIVMKTAIFMYNGVSEAYYKATNQLVSPTVTMDTYQQFIKYKYLDSATKLALLFRFWLSTRLCDHWKMWAFLQDQVGRISDEMRVSVMQNPDQVAVSESWRHIYELILDSDNIYAAMIATATLKSDVLRSVQDEQQREKLEKKDDASDNGGENMKGKSGRNLVDWEHLCVDAERLSLLSQQLEDVFLLNLLLRFSPEHGHLTDRYLYHVPRISVASIMRGGPSIVSELVAQWVVQSSINLKVVTDPYGSPTVDNDSPTVMFESSKLVTESKAIKGNDEHIKELFHHAKTSFPHSLDSDILLLHIVWQLGRKWAGTSFSSSKAQLITKIQACLTLFSNNGLKHKVASVAYKTFFQRTFERLALLIETNPNILSAKNCRTRESMFKKELDMSEDAIMDLVQFCCDLSEFMLQNQMQQENEESFLELQNRLLRFDDWWPTLSGLNFERRLMNYPDQIGPEISNSLVKTTLLSPQIYQVNYLIELNRIASILNLIVRLKIVRSYPIMVMGEESRVILQFDLQTSSPNDQQQLSSKHRLEPLPEMRSKFCRKCIVNVVAKLSDEINEFDEHHADGGTSSNADDDEDIGLPTKCDAGQQMEMFSNLLSIAKDWNLNCDELHMELVFELYRCNHDQLATHYSTRVQDQTMLASGLLKISSQRVLVLAGLSPNVSNPNWRKRPDRWSIFQPHVKSWLQSIQQEEMRRDIAGLSFSQAHRETNSFGLQTYVLHAVRKRTKSVLEVITNHLDGQACRMAYDLLQLLDSEVFDSFTNEDNDETTNEVVV